MKFLVVLFIGISYTLTAQNSLNGYKYVTVPKSFDFLKTEDKYQLNSLTKFLFEKEGFETLFDTDIRPQELSQNPCFGLISRVKDSSSMFTTKLIIELVNCRNETIFTSEEGRSKIKDFKKGYHQALRAAFESIVAQNYVYSYDPSNTSAATSIQVQKEEPKKVVNTEPEELNKEETKENIKEEAEKSVKEKPKLNEAIEEKPKKKTDEKETMKEKVPVETKVAKKKSEIEKKEPKETINSADNLLYAQENDQGYQLVDSTPKVVFILLKTSKKDIFLIKNMGGVLVKDGEKWFAEYYKGDTLVKEQVQIKF